MDTWDKTVKLYHYTEYLETIDNIISSTSLETRERDKDINIPRIQRMKNRTYYIRNTQPELARGMKIIADCLIDLYNNPSFLNSLHVTTTYVIVSRFSYILQFKKGEERTSELEDLKTQVEEQKPPAQHTFRNLINSILHV